MRTSDQTAADRRVGVLFVCLGNICRSPLAEGAFRAHVEAAGLGDRFEIDSAGTGRWHVGEAPDPRSVEEARRHGIDISGQRARQFTTADYRRFDHIVVMDESNRCDVLVGVDDPADVARVSRLLDALDDGPEEVPDPYYGGPGGFRRVWTLVNDATGALLARIRRARGF